LLASLTWKLIVVPELAWPRLTAACDRGEALPSPIAHVASIGGMSAVATLLGSALRAGSTVGSVTIAVLAAIAGYVGSATLAVSLVPRLIEAPEAFKHLVSRFASAAALPMVASGLVNVIPLSVISVMAVAVSSALTFRSGSLGARDFLGMEGARRKRAATVTTVVSTLPALIAALFRAAR
jgi:hypothetical protein